MAASTAAGVPASTQRGVTVTGVPSGRGAGLSSTTTVYPFSTPRNIWLFMAPTCKVIEFQAFIHSSKEGQERA
jgi:hypothetical protein